MKNSSKNVESRIGIRDSKFLTYSYTHTSSFIFEKKSPFENLIFRNFAKSGFLEILMILENVKFGSTPGGP